MGLRESDLLYWVVQPLIDAGLSRNEMETLLLHLAFDAIVTDDEGPVALLDAPVRGQPAEVRTAWVTTLGRMIALEVSTDPSAPASGP